MQSWEDRLADLKIKCRYLSTEVMSEMLLFTASLLMEKETELQSKWKVRSYLAALESDPKELLQKEVSLFKSGALTIGGVGHYEKILKLSLPLAGPRQLGANGEALQ